MQEAQAVLMWLSPVWLVNTQIALQAMLPRWVLAELLRQAIKVCKAGACSDVTLRVAGCCMSA